MIRINDVTCKTIYDYPSELGLRTVAKRVVVLKVLTVNLIVNGLTTIDKLVPHPPPHPHLPQVMARRYATEQDVKHDI